MGGGIFRARLRPDGFVSLDEGSITTKPLVLNGAKDLSINAVGPVLVEALSAEGKMLGSTIAVGDSLAHAVNFGGKTLDQVAAGANPTLRFKVDPPGRLYSFTVR